MKKEKRSQQLKLILVLILFFAIIALANAQLSDLQNTIDTNKEKLENKVDTTKETVNQITNPTQTNISTNTTTGEVLANGWKEYLLNNKTLHKLAFLNPVVKYLIGQDFDISWKFFTGVAIWFIMLFTMLGALDMVFDNKLLVISLCLIMSGLISRIAVPIILDKTTNLLKNGSDKFSKYNGPSLFIIALFIIILVNRGFKELKKYLDKKKFEKKVDTAITTANIISNETEKAKSMAEGAEKENEEEVKRQKQLEKNKKDGMLGTG